jgi:hypothetical protein
MGRPKNEPWKKVGPETISGPKYSREDWIFISAILNGESFEKYAARTGRAKQTVSESFYRAFVRVFPSFKKEIKTMNLNDLREFWNTTTD